MMSLLTQIPAVAEKLGEGLSGLAVNYRHSPIIEEHAAGRAGPAAGDRAPDAPLVAAKGGAPLRLYDLFAEHRHVLLLVGDGPEAVPPTMSRYAESIFAAHRIVAPGISGGDYIDSEGEVAKRYGSAPAAYLIRPDGYVGFRCDGHGVSTSLAPYLAKLFSPAASG
jgi:hypothetical protein